MFTDLFAFKNDDDVKRHIIRISVDTDHLNKLIHPSEDFEYLMLKNFNKRTIYRAFNDLQHGKFFIPSKLDKSICGYFNHEQYEKFRKIVNESDFDTINHCAKILFFWLMK